MCLNIYTNKLKILKRKTRNTRKGIARKAEKKLAKFNKEKKKKENGKKKMEAERSGVGSR